MFSPLDEELELLPGQLSPALADCVARLGTTTPFAQVSVFLKQFAGAKIQQFVDLHAPRAIRVLDFSHAAGYVHAVGHALAEGSCGDWCEARLSELAEDEPALVLTTLKGLSVSLAEEHPARGVAQHSLAYLAKREEQIQYHRFRAAQLPIGSGIVESANKLLVEARCKGAGMHWRPENVNHLLALRCADQSAHWETTTACAQEHLRLSRVQARRTAQRARRAQRRRKIVLADRPPVPGTARHPYFDAHGHPTNDHPFKRYRAISPRRAKL